MNSSDEKTTRKVLEAFAQVTASFRDRAVELERLPKVKKALTAIEFYKSTNGTALLSGYLDAEIADGTTTSWLLDLTWTDENWTIESKLVRSSGGEQLVLQELPTTTIQTVAELPQLLIKTASQLLELRSSWL